VQVIGLPKQGGRFPTLRLINGNTTLAVIPGKGIGVLSRKTFVKGEIIEENMYMRFDNHERDLIWATKLRQYVYSWHDGTSDKTIVLARGNLNFCNHSVNQNSEFYVYQKPEIIRLVASTDIIEGEEITINYGYPTKFMAL
jgi:uncharacterized protein